MKLELKHLAPYLPYDLKVFSGDSKVIYKLTSINAYKSTYSRLVELSQSDSRFYGQSIDYCKLILRPLSDLTKEIEYNGKKFTPIELYNTNLDINILSGLQDLTQEQLKTAIWNLDYRLITELLQWHFDIFDLIRNGLAVDINSL